MSEGNDARLPELHTRRVLLRHAQPGSEAIAVAFFERNRDHFARWDPPPPADFFSREYWQRNLSRMVDDFHADRAVRFDLFHADRVAPDGPLIGRIGFSQIARGPFQSCMLGYQIDRDCEGQGLMFEALQAAIRYMFDVKGLHRIQANHLPENERSARVLQRLHFQREGLARNYLFIAGAWRDHVLNALTNPAFDTARLTR